MNVRDKAAPAHCLHTEKDLLVGAQKALPAGGSLPEGARVPG